MATKAPAFFRFLNLRVPSKLLHVSGAGIYRLTGGLAFLPAKVFGLSVLVLTTIGRKTGKPRHSAMSFVRDGDALVVCASGIAKQTVPAWYLNLQANPRAQAQVGWREFQVEAAPAAPSERSRLRSLFPMKVQDRFQAMLSREIPVMVLRRIDSTEVSN